MGGKVDRRAIWRRTTLAIGLLTAAPGASALELEFATMHFPPYVELQEGMAQGPLVRLLLGACGQLRWQCRIQVLPWRRATAQIERGEADGAFPLLETVARRQTFHLSLQVVDIQYAFFSRAGQSFDYQEGQRLGRRQVGVFGPSGTATVLQALVGTQPTTVVVEPDNGVVLRKLLALRYGEDGLAFVNRDVAWQLAYEQGLTGLREAGVAQSAAYVFGLSRRRVGEADFRAFDQALAQLCRSGAAATLLAPRLIPSAVCAGGHKAAAPRDEPKGVLR